MVRKIPNRCLARRADGNQCYSCGTRTVIGIPLCDSHAADMAEAFGVEDAVKVVHVAATGPHVVYYAGNPETQAVKIGTSHDFRKRYVHLRGRYSHLKLLAVEPGHFDLESARHRQFRHLRVGPHGAQREWFRKADDLMAHISLVASTWGDPFRYAPSHSKPRKLS